MPQINGRESLIDGLRQVVFDLDVAGERVPALAILPSDADAPMPLVLIAHPGTSSKEDYFVRDVAMSWAKRGWICAGIDAPLHGDRDVHDPMRLFREPERYPAIRSQFAAEISATIDALCDSFLVDANRIGFAGYSMGSMLGIAAVARDGRFRAAAFGLVGEGGLAGSAAGEDSDVGKLAHVAVRIIGKTQDQLIPRDATEALYAALPGTKDIVWLPGGHFEIGPDVVKSAEEWMLKQL